MLIDVNGEGTGEDPLKNNQVRKGEGPAEFAARNGLTLGELASLNPDVFKNYTSDKAYWENLSGENWMIHPEQELNIKINKLNKNSSENGQIMGLNFAQLLNKNNSIAQSKKRSDQPPGEIRGFSGTISSILSTLEPYQQIMSYSSIGLDVIGEYTAFEHNKIAKNQFKLLSIEKVDGRQFHVDPTGKKWLNVGSSSFKKFPSLLTRYSNIAGLAGGTLDVLDISITWNIAINSKNSDDVIKNTVEGYLKIPGLTPGYFGVAYGAFFDYSVKPLWETGAKANKYNIKLGADPSYLFHVGGLSPAIPIPTK
jgi:hypothetical protein